MIKETKLAVRLSRRTRELLAKHAPRTGFSEDARVEHALLHHLQALDALPAEYIVNPRIVVTRRTFEEMIRQVSSAEPTRALRELMRGGDRPVRKPKR